MTAPRSVTVEYKTREHDDGWEVYRLTTDQYGQKEHHLTIVEDMHDAHGLVEQLTHETQDIMRKLAHEMGGRIKDTP